MKCNRPSVKVEDKDFPSTCSKKKGNQFHRFKIPIQLRLAFCSGVLSGALVQCLADPRTVASVPQSPPPPPTVGVGPLGSRGDWKALVGVTMTEIRGRASLV